jgi:RNA polymerase sigma factor (TIGR02999 family)
MHAITRLIQERGGEPARLAAELLPLVYDELRQLARALMSGLRPGQTLEPTALVHEAYLRIVGDHDPGWANRRHFYAAAARVMRFILVDRARSKATVKRGGLLARAQDFPDVPMEVTVPHEDLLALEEALGRLEASDPRKGQIVNLRYFMGLTESETAEVLQVSRATVAREWRYIRIWLYRQLQAS